MLQFAALFGTAIAGVGIGSAVSALSRTEMQAVMYVPLILIPQIVFSGFTVPPADMSKSALAVSRLTPTFSAQTVMDTSFLWKKELGGELMRDHRQSYSNLVPDRDLSTGDIFERGGPATHALLGLLAWTIGSYAVAWVTLKKRERV
jgi:ABC-type transport system involved in multi-copper enzyme maturation permease subunit